MDAIRMNAEIHSMSIIAEDENRDCRMSWFYLHMVIMMKNSYFLTAIQG